MARTASAMSAPRSIVRGVRAITSRSRRASGSAVAEEDALQVTVGEERPSSNLAIDDGRHPSRFDTISPSASRSVTVSRTSGRSDPGA